ncbi:Glu-tRNA(Gln) amidotransferase subunit GatD [Candidatus Bathyarchaeota archaeon]|nr:Glu-tRNA(Gln) amidotransferase subunit GatD [Candidatus Bathyarchaeota archaeon]
MMNEDVLRGYRGRLREKLGSEKIGIGDLIKVEYGEKSYEGILMPRLESADEFHIVIKLKTGYNVGIAFEEDMKIVRLKEAKKPTFKPPPLPESSSDLPEISIISTGGTIASRVDYATGGVHAAISSRDLLSIVPELSEIAKVEGDILFSVFSENIEPKDWSMMAKRVADKIKSGFEGIVITHGTDTMGYSAAALSFALSSLPVPVIFVGSQRSSDRPSSDAASNLIAAVSAAAQAPFAEVVLAMHETSSDDSIVFHRGTKVRKCHTSSRYAFQSVNSKPLARFRDRRIEMIEKNFRHRGGRELILRDKFNERVALLKFHPGFNPEIIDWAVDEGYKGIILEGTGLGHVSSKCYKSIERAIHEGLIICMTSQCIWGRINMNVYSTGRELINLGVTPLEDMLTETAFVKLTWALSQSNSREEALKLMATNLAGEFSHRTLYTWK